MKRKIAAVLLCLIMGVAVVFTGCSLADIRADLDRDQEEQAQRMQELEEMREELREIGQNVGAVPEEKQEETEPEETEPTETAEAETIEATRGSIENGMFLNETFHVSFPVSDDMVVFTDEQILQAMGMSADALVDNKVYTAKQMETAMAGSVFDTMIMMPDGSSNFVVLYENLDVTAHGISVTESQYLQIVTNGVRQSVAEECSISEMEEVTVGGQEYTKVDITQSQGYVTTYLVRIQDNYVVSMIYTCVGGREEMREDFFQSMVEVQ